MFGNSGFTLRLFFTATLSNKWWKMVVGEILTKPIKSTHYADLFFPFNRYHGWVFYQCLKPKGWYCIYSYKDGIYLVFRWQQQFCFNNSSSIVKQLGKSLATADAYNVYVYWFCSRNWAFWILLMKNDFGDNAWPSTYFAALLTRKRLYVSLMLKQRQPSGPWKWVLNLIVILYQGKLWQANKFRWYMPLGRGHRHWPQLHIAKMVRSLLNETSFNFANKPSRIFPPNVKI